MDKKPKIWYDYLKWLLKKVNFNKKEWYNLLKTLHDMPFEWTEEVPMDRNRAMDGIFLRDEFFRSLGINNGEFPYECSIVEMLVAFTMRMSDEYINPYGYDGEEHIDYIFYFFLKCLGLNNFLNISDDEIKEKVSIWVLREYKNDGIGSIFPLKKNIKGYNLIEIWNQMQIFLYENRIENVENLLEFAEKL